MTYPDDGAVRGTHHYCSECIMKRCAQWTAQSMTSREFFLRPSASLWTIISETTLSTNVYRESAIFEYPSWMKPTGGGTVPHLSDGNAVWLYMTTTEKFRPWTGCKYKKLSLKPRKPVAQEAQQVKYANYNINRNTHYTQRMRKLTQRVFLTVPPKDKLPEVPFVDYCSSLLACDMKHSCCPRLHKLAVQLNQLFSCVLHQMPLSIYSALSGHSSIDSMLHNSLRRIPVTDFSCFNTEV